MLGWLRSLFAGRGHAPRRSTGLGATAYQHLRSQALSLERAAAGIPAPPPEAPVWGLLMDMGFPNGTATLVALADGTTSLYHSGGGGVLGGQAHEAVRRANAALLAEADGLVTRMSPTSTYRFRRPGLRSSTRGRTRASWPGAGPTRTSAAAGTTSPRCFVPAMPS